MENFFKAHSSQKLKSCGIHNKFKSKVKKMLNGYNKNDKNVIRDAVDNCVEESDVDQPICSDSDVEYMYPKQTSKYSENNDDINSSPSEADYEETSCKTEEEESLFLDNESGDESFEERSDFSDSDHSFEHNEHVDSSDKDLSNSCSLESDVADSENLEPNTDNTCDYNDLSVLNDATSSSTFSEFDAEGHLARAIIEKINVNRIKPSTSGYIQIKKKRKINSNEKYIDGCSNKKMKKNIYSNAEHPAYTFDVSNQDLPEIPNIFKEYNFTTTKLLKQNLTSQQESFFIPEKLNNVEITDGSINTSLEVEPTMNVLTEELMEITKIDDESAVKLGDSFSNQNAANVEFHRARNGYVVILHYPAQLYIHGKVKVTRLAGAVDIMGHKLRNLSVNLFAPRFSYAQIIKTLPAENNKFGLFSKLRTLGFTVLATEDIVVSITEFDSVLYLEELEDNYNFVQAEFPGLDIFQMSKKSIEEFPDVSKQLSCSIYSDKPYKAFEEIPVWPEIVKFGKGHTSKGVICGGKGTGKSTFLKYYINSLLSEGPVLVLDLDPGQAEFTVSGGLSVVLVTEPIIGPNFTHLTKPQLMLNIGTVNVLDNIERYISAVTEILKYAQKEEFTKTRCIINTMGMSNSLGLKILTYITITFPITFLVQMDSGSQHKCFEMLLTPLEIKRFYSDCEDDPVFANITCPENLDYKYFMSTHSRQPRGENVTPKDKRYLCFLSYFRKALKKNTLNLLSVRPYIVKLDSIRIATSCHIEEKAITSVLNGKIVALCEENTNSTERTFTLEENALFCHGYGLVRGIDLNSESLYLISSECGEVLSRVNVLLYGDSHPDLKLDDKVLPAGTFVPYRTVLRPHNKQLLHTPKRRFNPLQLIKMKRNNLSRSQ